MANFTISGQTPTISGQDFTIYASSGSSGSTPADTDPGAAFVAAGRTYVFNGQTIVGTFDPVAGRYTDPGAANVLAPTTYVFAGATVTGTASPSGGQGGGFTPTDSANLAAIKAVTDSIARCQITGSVAGNASTLAFSGNAALSTIDGFYTGAVLTFQTAPVSGLGGLSLRIAGYLGATRTLQFSAGSPWPVAPVAGDTFLIQGRID